MGRNVVIVGGGAALAQPLIEHFMSNGDRVTAVCRTTTPDRPEATMAGVEEPFKVVKRVADADGLIDVLVTLTGSTDDTKLYNMFSEAENSWDRVVEDTLTAPARAMTDAFLRMLEGGNVVVVGSVVGSTGAYGAANYAAAKAGLVGLVRSASLEWARNDIKVNLLELGFMDAGMGARLDLKVKERVLKTIPLGRFGAEADFVHAVEFLSTTKYMTGGILTLAGGLR